MTSFAGLILVSIVSLILTKSEKGKLNIKKEVFLPKIIINSPFSFLKNEEMLKNKFTEFKKTFAKKYNTPEEEVRRFAIYKENMKKASELQDYVQRLNPLTDLSFGHTQFSDLTQEEFQQNFLTLKNEDFSQLQSQVFNRVLHKASKPAAEAAMNKALDKTIQISSEADDLVESDPQAHVYKNSYIEIDALPFNNLKNKLNLMQNKQDEELPTSLDYRQYGITTPIKNQKACGACWSFASATIVECLYKIFTYDQEHHFSTQQQINCNYDSSLGNFACQGGLVSKALSYIRDNGLTSEESYPYLAVKGDCNKNWIVTPKNIKVYTSWSVSSKELDMKDILYNYGPSVVAIESSKLSSYVGGIVDSSIGCTNSVNHAVVLIGYGIQTYSNGSKIEYWIIQNSWGASWGEQGYFRLKIGQGACGINTMMFTAGLY